MPPESAAPVEGAAAPVAESGSFDAGQWFQEAGLNAQETDPATVAEAIEFRKQWEGKQPLDESAVFERAQQLRSKDWELSLIHISEPTRLLSISYAVFCLKK